MTFAEQKTRQLPQQGPPAFADRPTLLRLDRTQMLTRDERASFINPKVLHAALTQNPNELAWVQSVYAEYAGMVLNPTTIGLRVQDAIRMMQEDVGELMPHEPMQPPSMRTVIEMVFDQVTEGGKRDIPLDELARAIDGDQGQLFAQMLNVPLRLDQKELATVVDAHKKQLASIRRLQEQEDIAPYIVKLAGDFLGTLPPVPQSVLALFQPQDSMRDFSLMRRRQKAWESTLKAHYALQISIAQSFLAHLSPGRNPRLFHYMRDRLLYFAGAANFASDEQYTTIRALQQKVGDIINPASAKLH